MNVNTNTTPYEFLELLFRSCQDANMPTPVLDAIEDLFGLLDLEPALEKINEEKEKTEGDASDLYDELKTLRDGLGELLDGWDHDRLTGLFGAADKALERHEEYK